MGKRKRKGLEEPKVLKAVYGDRLHLLLELVHQLLGPFSKSHILRDDDPPDYRFLLCQTYAALHEAAPQLGLFTLEQRWSQRQIVERVIELQFKKNERPAHVLCFGYQQNLECAFQSTIVDAVNSSAWCILHSRVGDMLMLHLLSHAAVFTSLPNSCYMQVSGAPITLSASTGQRRISQCFLEQFSPQHGPMEVTKSVSVKCPTKDEGEVDAEQIKARKRSRSFSWQRRKRQKVNEVEEIQTQPEQRPCHRQVDRGPMFYSTGFSPKPGLPQNHILFKAGTNAASLFESIFRGPSNSNASIPSIMKPLKQFVLRAKKFRCGHLLKRHCPVADRGFGKEAEKDLKFDEMFLEDGYKTQEDAEAACSCELTHFGNHEAPKQFTGINKAPSLPELLAKSSTHHQVVSFLWASIRRLVPPALLGSTKCWRTLRRQLACFVGLRRYEVFSTEQCLHKLKVGEFSFLSTKGNKTLQKLGYSKVQMLEDWLFWMFSNIVVPLIRMHFYVTESESERQNVKFYRKSVWTKIQSAILSKLSKTIYKRVDADKVLKKRALGFSNVRLLPKKKNVRPIANLGSASMYIVKRKNTVTPVRGREKTVHVKHRRKSLELNGCRDIPRCGGSIQAVYTFKSVNSGLSDAHQCLKLELENHRDRLGASVFGYSDIYRKFLPFVRQYRDLPGLPKLYLAVCDVANAFDTISQDKLCEIIDGFLHEDKYQVLRFSSVRTKLASVRVHHEKACATPNDHRNFHRLVSSLSITRSATIFTDQVYNSILTRCQLLKLLREHVKSNILHVGQTFFQQITGIPQGSILSSLLCALYYGHLDLKYTLPLLQAKSLPGECGKSEEQLQQRSILLRLVDDSLFITTSASKASRFLSIMHAGLKDFGCAANREKTSTNFLTDDGSGSTQNLYQTEDGACFIRWSGLLINCHTLEVQADYTRYCGGLHIKSSLTVTRWQKQGLNLVIKMFHFMRPKCHPLFYDSAINSPSTTSLNVYQAFLLCAMKFHAYLKELRPLACRNPPFLFQAIRKTTRYTVRLIHRRMRAVKAGKLLVNVKEVEWLGFTAFHRVLSRKQSSHRSLLKLISKELRMKRYKDCRLSPQLLSATDERRSSMFKSIRY